MIVIMQTCIFGTWAWFRCTCFIDTTQWTEFFNILLPMLLPFICPCIISMICLVLKGGIFKKIPKLTESKVMVVKLIGNNILWADCGKRNLQIFYLMSSRLPPSCFVAYHCFLKLCIARYTRVWLFTLTALANFFSLLGQSPHLDWWCWKQWVCWCWCKIRPYVGVKRKTCQPY